MKIYIYLKKDFYPELFFLKKEKEEYIFFFFFLTLKTQQ